MPTLPSIIDHTLLKPDTTAEDVRRLCQEALDFGFASVCVMPSWGPIAAAELEGSDVRLCLPIGFPLGAHRTSVKVAESLQGLDDGAAELDMVIDLGSLFSGDLDAVRADIAAVAAATHDRGALLKVILETGILPQDLKATACLLAVEAGADFVKTATGFNGGGATVEDVRLLASLVPRGVGVKASGGIRNAATAVAMIKAGATRIGTSAGVAIAEELEILEGEEEE